MMLRRYKVQVCIAGFALSFLLAALFHWRGDFLDEQLQPGPWQNGVSVLNRNDRFPAPHTLSPEQRSRFSGLLSLDSSQRLALTDCLHLMLLFGPNACIHVEAVDKSFRLIDVATNTGVGDDILKCRSIAKTKAGIRFDNDAHRDQSLSVLALLGIPLSQVIEIDAQHYSVADGIADSKMNFYLKNEELSWTLMAYSIYSTETDRWRNAFGEVCTVEDIALELLSRGIADESCGGAHRLSGLTVFLLGVRSGNIRCSASTRRRTENYLREAFSAVAQSQSPEGAIELDWVAHFVRDNRQRLDPVPRGSPLLVSGHFAEWIRMLPLDLVGNDRVLELARQWISRETAAVTLDEIRAEICPFTHALLALEST